MLSGGVISSSRIMEMQPVSNMKMEEGDLTSNSYVVYHPPHCLQNTCASQFVVFHQ